MQDSGATRGMEYKRVTYAKIIHSPSFIVIGGSNLKIPKRQK